MSDFDQEVRGVDGYSMPATQHDLWLWVVSHAYGKVFDVTREYDGGDDRRHQQCAGGDLCGPAAVWPVHLPLAGLYERWSRHLPGEL